MLIVLIRYSYYCLVRYMDIKTPKEFFEKVLPTKFNPVKAVGIDCIVQMNLSGDNGGDWIITIKEKRIEIKEGIHPSPTVAVKMKDIEYVNARRKRNEFFEWLQN